jgi:hypothetical protein
MDQITIGESLLVRHPQTLQLEERIVTSILSNRSLTIHEPFSSDFVSTTEFFVISHSRRKEAESSRVKQEPGDEHDERPEESVQGRLDKKLRDGGSIVTYQVKSGQWGYKSVAENIGKEVSKEDLLNMRIKKVHDKYC